MKKLLIAGILAIVFPMVASATEAQPLDVMPTTLEDLQPLDDAQLNELYDYGSAYVIPGADEPGIELLLTGLPLPVPGHDGPSELLNFFWGGKVFMTDQVGNTTLTNKLLPTTPATFNDVSAEVKVKDNSLTNDGEPVVFLDYKNSNIAIARILRDEIRLIAPNLYLGRAYLKNGLITKLMTGEEHTFALWFALENKE